MDIKIIPIDELLKDLDCSFADVLNCEAALKLGVTNYSGGSIADRLLTNQKIIERIKRELKIRKTLEE